MLVDTREETGARHFEVSPSGRSGVEILRWGGFFLYATVRTGSFCECSRKMQQLTFSHVFKIM